jgi:hypothetical protein
MNHQTKIHAALALACRYMLMPTANHLSVETVEVFDSNGASAMVPILLQVEGGSMGVFAYGTKTEGELSEFICGDFRNAEIAKREAFRQAGEDLHGYLDRMIANLESMVEFAQENARIARDE